METLSHALLRTTAAPDSMLASLREIVETGIFRKYLEDLIDSPDALEECARMCYLHPNGFYKLVLFSELPWQLRLHLYQDSRSLDNPSELHNHRWSFASYPLFGLFRHAHFRESREGEIATVKYRYEPRRANDKIKLERVGEQLLRTTFLQEWGGSSPPFYIDETIVHQFDAIEFPAATLMLHGGFVRDDTDVYRLHGALESEMIVKESPALSATELGDLLRKHLRVCGGG